MSMCFVVINHDELHLHTPEYFFAHLKISMEEMMMKEVVVLYHAALPTSILKNESNQANCLGVVRFPFSSIRCFLK